MAKALQCPSCGATTRIDALPASGAVRCESCGQTMKVPPGLGRKGRRGDEPAAPTPTRGVDAPPAASAPSAPAPPRRGRGRAPAAAPVAAAGGTAVLAPSPAPPTARPTASPGAPARPAGPVGRTARGDDGGRDQLPLVLRIGAWIVALPLGLLLVGLPARQLGYLSSQKLLDVIVKRDLGRFLPIAVVIVLWALVSAVLVTLIVEGGRRWMLRRRRKKTTR